MNKRLVWLLKALGVLILLYFAIIYRGGKDDDLSYFGPRWWGILGLIGWAYLGSALIYLFSKDRFGAVFMGWLAFCLISISATTDFTPPAILSFIPEPICSGTMTALCLGGVLTSMIFRYYRKKNEDLKLSLIYIGGFIILILLAVWTRPYLGGISKLRATPPWLFLCSGFTLAAFLIIYWLADKWKKAHWFKPIKPAGTDTLLCYLVPHFFYAILRFGEIKFPASMLDGGVGLFKSFMVASICVLMTWGLNRIGIRLKL